MRNDNTPWNRSYKDPALDTGDLEKQLRKKRRALRFSPRQQYNAKFWDRHFAIRPGAVRPATRPHPDDLAIGDSRKKVDAAQEDRALRDSLKEVWE